MYLVQHSIDLRRRLVADVTHELLYNLLNEKFP